MDAVIQGALDGLHTVFSWPNILYPVVGTLLAMTAAAIPGVSAVTLMALAIPLTLSWDLVPVVLLFGSFLGGGTFMGSVTAILINVPGAAPNAATTIDGYPMAQRGEAKTALACAATASALGSVFGVLVLIACIPFFPQLFRLVGPPELFLMAVWGLSTMAVVSQESLLKGLAMGGLGLTLSFIGLDPRTAEERLTFGSLYLVDGLSLIPVFLGIFAIAETIDLAASNKPTISGMTRRTELTGSLREGSLSVLRNPGLFLRCATLGSVVGMIPGIGGTVASFLAYGHAARSAARGGHQFGRGDIRGVLAPEAANDAKDGGSLIPTLVFGVPGSAGTAVLISVLVLHGLIPGGQLVDSQLGLVFALIWALVLSNLITSWAGLAAAGQLARLTLVRTQLLVPLILMVAMLGAYTFRGRLDDVVVTIAFGMAGYYMKRFEWPRIALVIAFVLGPLLETNLHLTMRLYELGRIDPFTRAPALFITALIAASIGMPLWRRIRGLPS